MDKTMDKTMDKGLLQRLSLYLGEMYPPGPAMAMAVVSFLNVFFMLAVLHSKPFEINWPVIAGSLTLFLFLLFLRISDELKDFESDKVLFPERLVPSGQVLVSDLNALMAFSVGAMVLLNLTMPQSLLAFGLLFAYGVLMFNYFFLRRWISRSLLLALITHNPSVLLMNAYVIAVFCTQYDIAFWQPLHLQLIVLFWLPGLAWELARKIRAPQDETEYETYSKIFGYKLAALLPLAALSLHYFLLVRLHSLFNFSPVFLLLLSLALIGLMLRICRFVLRPDTRSARLKPVTEGYLLVAAGALLLDLLVQRGMLWIF